MQKGVQKTISKSCKEKEKENEFTNVNNNNRNENVKSSTLRNELGERGVAALEVLGNTPGFGTIVEKLKKNPNANEGLIAAANKCNNDNNTPPCRNLHLKPPQSTLRRAPWWSTPSISTIGFGLAILLVFIISTVQFCLYWRAVSEEVSEAAEIYVTAFRAIAVTLGFYVLAFGIMQRGNLDVINSFHENSSDIEGAMLDYYPASLRLYKSIYATDPYLRTTSVPPDIDIEQRNYVEIVLCSVLFISIDNTLALTPLADQGFIETWRSWFRSPIVREQWPSSRPFYGEYTVRFVEQNLFPDSPLPCPSVWRIISDDQLMVVLFMLTFIWIVGTMWYWYSWCFPPLGKMIDLYFKCLEALFIGALILLLVYDINETATTGLITFNSRDVIEIEEGFLEHYPDGVIIYQQMYQENCRLQAIKPKNINLNRQLMTCSAISGILFQTIESVLNLQSSPDIAFVRSWDSWFNSCIIHTLWPANRQYFETSTVEFIDRNLLKKRNPCVGCSQNCCNSININLIAGNEATIINAAVAATAFQEEEEGET